MIDVERESEMEVGGWLYVVTSPPFAIIYDKRDNQTTVSFDSKTVMQLQGGVVSDDILATLAKLALL